MGEDEIEAVTTVLRSGWLTMGEETRAFEAEFAAFIGVKHAFMVSNCTTALHLAHHVLGVGPGDEVLCPSLTFVATANSIVQTGATPKFVDVAGADDLCESPEDIERRISPRTKGIVAVHYAGYPCRMEQILTIARQHRLYVVEDCAHSPGASVAGRMTGAFGDLACFSFFSNKNLSTGEGGMVVTDRNDLAERIRLLRSHGMTTVTLDRHKGHCFSYDVLMKGFNYRSTEISAAIGRVQLQKLAGKNERRRQLTLRYPRRRLAGIAGLTVPFRFVPDGVFSSHHIQPVLLSDGQDRERAMVALKEKGIQTSIHYRPVHSFTAYKNDGLAPLPVTDLLAGRLVTLPLYPTMTDAQVDYVVESLAAVLGRNDGPR